jgi:antitoxin component of RelBE/YafQ-DinJ toxin-antitoxin module
MKSKNRLNYTISPDVEKLLREYADVSGLKMSKIVEMALTQYIKNEKNKIRNL